MYENLPCCLKRLNNRNIISTLKSDIPDFNLIKGSRTKSNGATSKNLPAKNKIIPKKIEVITIKTLTFFETFRVLAFANEDNISIKIIKIIIPKNSKFIY